MTAVLLNRQRHLIDLNLLDHTGLAPGWPAPGTKIDTMIESPGVYDLGRERIPLMLQVSGLATFFCARSWPSGAGRLARNG